MTARLPSPDPAYDGGALRFDHLELWVGNAKQAAEYYITALGFRPLAYAGPETGLTDRASYVVAQGEIRLVLTSALRPGGPINDHVARHGDGVRSVAFATPDAAATFRHVVAHGAVPVLEPVRVEENGSRAVLAAVGTYGDTIHKLVERAGAPGIWLPGFVPWESAARANAPAGLLAIDHCVGNVGWGEMERWCRFYAEAFDFQELVSFDDRDISTEFTALRSKVMRNASGTIKLPINEPAPGRKRSQIEEYLDSYGGAGVQHVAIATADIVATVRALQANGVELLSTPEAYYDDLRARVGEIDEDIAALRELNILVDRDDQGYMLQIFTKPLQDRPTLFFEIIQRHGAESFGKGNFKALFVSIEKEQARRGNL
ncbi:MAG TPA: 4-hydroxyphenylpyruvate dioxygenase [Candidatus Lustribacter sp.]|nr:4-hydroxyphenylpyruvate dioxygenase [Candidatus Lustribacter sp.]